MHLPSVMKAASVMVLAGHDLGVRAMPVNTPNSNQVEPVHSGDMIGKLAIGGSGTKPSDDPLPQYPEFFFGTQRGYFLQTYNMPFRVCSEQDAYDVIVIPRAKVTYIERGTKHSLDDLGAIRVNPTETEHLELAARYNYPPYIDVVYLISRGFRFDLFKWCKTRVVELLDPDHVKEKEGGEPIYFGDLGWRGLENATRRLELWLRVAWEVYEPAGFPRPKAAWGGRRDLESVAEHGKRGDFGNLLEDWFYGLFGKDSPKWDYPARTEEKLEGAAGGIEQSGSENPTLEITTPDGATSKVEKRGEFGDWIEDWFFGRVGPPCPHCHPAPDGPGSSGAEQPDTETPPSGPEQPPAPDKPIQPRSTGESSPAAPKTLPQRQCNAPKSTRALDHKAKWSHDYAHNSEYADLTDAGIIEGAYYADSGAGSRCGHGHCKVELVPAWEEPHCRGDKHPGGQWEKCNCPPGAPPRTPEEIRQDQEIDRAWSSKPWWERLFGKKPQREKAGETVEP